MDGTFQSAEKCVGWHDMCESLLKQTLIKLWGSGRDAACSGMGPVSEFCEWGVLLSWHDPGGSDEMFATA
jgi:hypothetical protein